MAWPAATTLTSFLMLLLITIATSFSPRIIATTQAPFGRILKAVKLPGGYMEVVQEQRCSQGLLRLTCRSLRAFIFILEAEYHANRTEFCQKDLKSLKEELKMWNKGSTWKRMDMQELKGNYILDDEDIQADIVDIRSSLNKRCSGQKHCRYNVTIEHPGAYSWVPGGILLKYACIPDKRLIESIDRMKTVRYSAGQNIPCEGRHTWRNIGNGAHRRCTLRDGSRGIEGRTEDQNSPPSPLLPPLAYLSPPSIQKWHPYPRNWGKDTLVSWLSAQAAVKRYCNQQVKVISEEGGYLNTPGYPLYYIGETCGWTFRTFNGQRIVLTFHDLNIRGPDANGNCMDIVRVRDRGSTLFEFCGTAAGVRVVSYSNVLTLDFVASKRFYNGRGFLLQYQVLGCPEVLAPNGSYVSNGTLTSRTFLCNSGSVFPDSRERKRTLECRNGKWNETTTELPDCVATSAVIVKSENEHHHLASISGDNILGTGVRIGRGEDAVASGSVSPVMDSAQSAMMKQADYVVDVVLPTVLIALLFVGNAIIVYIIFQFRKRKLSATNQGEEMALRGPPDVPNV
ncbi:hypothetical protein ALC60_07531 [Trachymyrmex zeteki]|uniref:CUB domain-containing protein n=2 Tax=Attini TaxID=143999 RepID=A0A151WZP1_9HYME|nr:hypothetical protein ALC60_07531 [Trachymyrmex zeteki]